MLAHVSIIIAGVLCLVMAIFHTRFPKMFRWTEDFKKIQLANKRIFNTIHIALILLFVISALLTLLFYKELCNPDSFATALLISFSAFWVWRMIWQVLYFKIPKGAPLSACVMNYAMITVFTLLAIAYFMPVVL